MAVAFAPLMLGPAWAAAQGDAWERQVRQQLERATETLRRDGYAHASQVKIGSLNGAESDVFPLTLQGGVSYALMGVCDNDCTSLHLVLYNDAATYEVAAERTMNEAPLLRVTPRETTRYRLKAVMAGCGMSPCWYGIGIYRK